MMAVLRELKCNETQATQQSQPDTTTAVARKPKKAYHHKVRTGCYTCRKRRVKCDEAKPLCMTCTRMGYTCCGYPQSDPSQMVIVPHPTTLRGRDEHQAFQFFMETTMTWFDLKEGPCMHECHVNEFWNPVVLQITESEPAIKHILLAWAELHRRILYEPISPNEPVENDFFWQNHSEALRLLGTQKQIDVSIMLIACIMFCVLENFRGRRDIFLKHLQAGLRIIHDYDRQSTDATRSTYDGMITRYIRPILMTFELNLAEILEFEIVHSRERMADRLIKLKEAGRVVKTWN